MNIKGDLRVWWIPQVPGTPFYVSVKTVDEAILLLNTLADYDCFQFENNIKPDYCNAGGLMVYDSEDGEDDNAWTEWHNDDGDDIDAVLTAGLF